MGAMIGAVWGLIASCIIMGFFLDVLAKICRETLPEQLWYALKNMSLKLYVLGFLLLGAFAGYDIASKGGG